MTYNIACDKVASISELKINPAAAVESAGGKPLAILNRNKPAFYCVPAKLYEVMIEMLDDLKLAKIIEERSSESEISISVNEL